MNVVSSNVVVGRCSDTEMSTAMSRLYLYYFMKSRGVRGKSYADSRSRLWQY